MQPGQKPSAYSSKAKSQKKEKDIKSQRKALRQSGAQADTNVQEESWGDTPEQCEGVVEVENCGCMHKKWQRFPESSKEALHIAEKEMQPSVANRTLPKWLEHRSYTKMQHLEIKTTNYMNHNLGRSPSQNCTSKQQFFFSRYVRVWGSDGHKRLWFSVEQNCKAVKERTNKATN